MRNDLLKDLNPNQRQAVTFLGKPLLILAGAGSGKTRSLTYKAAWLIQEEGVNPENILLVTFTNKAANEMKERLKKLLTINYQLSAINLPFAGTFHSFCSRLLRSEVNYLGIAPNFLIYDENDQLEVVKQVLEKLKINKKFHPKAILSAISDSKNELITPSEYTQYAKGDFSKIVALVYPLYQNLLKKFNALDFDDLLFEAVRLFQKNPQVLNKYQNRFTYILVDEYQDTNHAQYELIRLLAKNAKNLTVVGDCSQSIYSWRGANFRNVLKLKQDFLQLFTINLERNYRSHQTILDAAFSVITHNTTHPVLKLWTDEKRDEKIVIYEAYGEENEADFIVKTIENLKTSPYSQSAVLYRTNAQSRVIEEAFLSSRIPYLLIGGVRFYQRKEIKDCLALLRLLLNSRDQLSYQRIEKLGKKRLEKFLEFAKKIKSSKFKTVKLLDKTLTAIDYFSLFDGKDLEDFGRIENLKELRSVATKFPNLSDFLENVSLIEKEQLPKNKANFKDDNKNAVSLMTLHAAKGTEFENVFIVGMEEGLFPHSRSLFDKEELEEERRLCYVGLTRAKKRLFLSFAKKRFYFGAKTTNEVSRFIKEIPEELVNFIS